MLLDVRTP
jgi:hypothetical protein